MPGYGYARAPKSEVAAWTRTVFDYLRGRPRLRRVYVLVDARHGLKPNDEEALATLDKAAVSYQIVLTKADKVKAADARGGDRRRRPRRIAKRPAAHPEVLATRRRPARESRSSGPRSRSCATERRAKGLPRRAPRRFVPLSQTRYRPGLSRAG